MNGATSELSRRRNVTGRCRRRERTENADCGLWTLWTGYLLEKMALGQVFIKTRAKCRHRYARTERNEAMKIKEGNRTVNEGTQGPLEHRQWSTELILEGNFLLGSDIWQLVGTYRCFSKTWPLQRWGKSPPTLIIKTTLTSSTISINPSPFGFQTSLMQFHVIHTVHIFVINTRINTCAS